MQRFKNKWGLIGGFIWPAESPEEAAKRILEECTGLKEVYMEQFMVFGNLDRDPVERTLSIAYFALIDTHKCKHQLFNTYKAKWFLLNKLPELISDHSEIVEQAIKRLRYKAALHPILFELLPPKFTIPQLQILYESVLETKFDERNFSRKLLSTNFFIKLNEKDKTSRKGAYYYELDRLYYKNNLGSLLHLKRMTSIEV